MDNSDDTQPPGLSLILEALTQSHLRAELSRNPTAAHFHPGQRSSTHLRDSNPPPSHSLEPRVAIRTGSSLPRVRRACVQPRAPVPRILDYGGCYRPDELVGLDATGAFKIPSTADAERVYRECANGLQTSLELACASCEMGFRLDEVRMVPLTDGLAESLKQCLQPASTCEVPSFIQKQYDASSIDTRLSELLLYPPGVVRDGDRVRVQLCVSCDLSIRNNHLPRLSIANGNYIGRFPLGEVPWIEEQLLALASPCVSIKTVTGGQQRCIRSHHYIVKNTAGPILEMLPHDAASRVRVTMAGAMTPQQIAICKRRHTVDIPRAQTALSFLFDHHKSYHSLRQHRDAVTATVTCWMDDMIEDRTEQSGTGVGGPTVERIDDTSSYAIPAPSVQEGPEVEGQWIEEHSIILNQADQADDYLVRQSTAFVTTERWAACVDMFPLLFPGGCGGPKEPRKKPLSVAAWAQRVLQLHNSSFQRHNVFLLLVFDYLALENARKKMFFRMKATQDAILAGSVTRDAMAECVLYRQHLMACQSTGTVPNPPSDTILSILDIQKGVQASEVAYYGSNRQRSQARSDLFGYIKRLGPLHLFFTISPDASGTYAIGVAAGIIDRQQLQQANSHILPTKIERRSIAARHPVACARYFIRVMDIVVKHILGWDEQRRLPFRSGGLFGVVKAYTAAAETQISGDLHAHFVVWLHGMPTTSSDMEKMLQEESVFRTRFTSLVDTVSSAVAPGLSSRCPRCMAQLDTATFPLSAYQPKQRAREASGPATTSRCIPCRQDFSAQDLLDIRIAASGITAPCEQDFIICSDPPLENAQQSDVDLAIILRQVQTHYWHHTPSCFKVTKKTPTAAVCRFLRPTPAELDPTHIDHKFDIHLHRPIGCEYLNPFNRVLARVFRCNHDVRFVISSSSKDVAAYICKYVMKPQNRIENDLAFRLGSMERATNNVEARNSSGVLSARERGNKVMSSLLYSMTNRQEMPASMAALFILRGAAFWWSHPVVGLNVPYLLATYETAGIVEDEVSIAVDDLDHDGPVFRRPNSLHAYWRRPIELEALSLAQISESYTYKPDAYTESSQSLMCLRGRALRCIEDYVDDAEREVYYKTLNVIFKPHRKDTLKHEGETHEQAYECFLRNGPPSAVSLARSYETNLRDSFTASKAAQDLSQEDVLLAAHSALHGLNYTGADSGEDSDAEEEIPVGVDLFADVPDISAERRLHRIDELLSHDPILERAIPETATQVVLRQATQHDAVETTPAEREPELGLNAGTTTFLATFATLPTRLQKLNECFAPVPWVDPASVPPVSVSDLPSFATIADVSLAFELNFWQHYGFETIARHVLYAYLEDIERAADTAFPRPHSSQLKPQLVSYLGGEAGAGKSRVVHALLAFARSWHRVGSIETLAFTGVAAINVCGRTLHSARNLSILENTDTRPSAEMKAKFRGVVLTIIDEISMTDQKLLGRADAVSREMSERRDLPWGGRHIVFGGDWIQILPVGGTPVFKVPTVRTSTTAAQGHELYKSVNFVVFLLENMRARTDLLYTSILGRMRWGKLTGSDIAALNGRVGTVSQPEQLRQCFKPVIVGTNDLRCAINYRFMLELARTGQVQLFEALATAPASSQEKLAKFGDYDDHFTGRMPLKFTYFIGMPVMITQRAVDPQLQAIIANGTIGHIVGHQLRNASMEARAVGGVSVLRHRELPAHLLVRLRDCDTQIHEDLPPGIVRLQPLHTRITITIPGPNARTAQKKPKLSKPTMTIDQFPLTPAFACTPEKLQGQTCKDGIVLAKLERAGKVLSPQALYVAFSRTVSLSKLTLTHPIAQHDINMFKPTNDTVEEMRRLQRLVDVPEYASPTIRRDFDAWLASQQVQ